MTPTETDYDRLMTDHTTFWRSETRAFTIDVGGEVQCISVDSLKPAHMDVQWGWPSHVAVINLLVGPLQVKLLRTLNQASPVPPCHPPV